MNEETSTKEPSVLSISFQPPCSHIPTIEDVARFQTVMDTIVYDWSPQKAWGYAL